MKRSIDLDDTMAADAISSDAAAGSSPALERIADRYEVLGLLGVGGMGAVYSVRDTRLDERVALKMLRRELLDSQDIRRRFLDEVRLARRVTHRNVARTFDLGEHEGALFLTMELLDGESLGARLAREGRMELGVALPIAVDVTSALCAAHAAGVVHRDLKPDNVFLARDGRAVVTDFGIARTQQTDGGNATAAIIGTPAYMAPEQVRGAPDVDARADLYALGELIYEMVTGVRAWPAPEPVLAMAARLTEPPPDARKLVPTLAPDLADLLLRLMAVAPAARPVGADQVQDVLRALVERSAPAAPEQRAPSVLPPAVARSDRSLAVLPPRNLGVAEYVAKGIHEDLVDTLATTRGLRVRPIGVTRPFEGSDRDPREIGATLGVQVIVELSVRAVGEAVRLSARAIGVDDGFVIWAERYQRPPSELLTVADQAAHAIASALTADLSAPPRPAAADPLGVDMYLRARADLREAYHSSVGLGPVTKLFDAAIALAPKDPHALAGAARAHQRLGFYARGEESAREMAIARDLADRAIALAPQLGESWIALAMSRLEDDEPVAAVRALHAALRVAPRHAEVREVLGRILLEAGELERGMGLLEDALELDPTAAGGRWDLSRGHALAGRWVQAEEALQIGDNENAKVTSAWMRARLATWRARDYWQAPLSDQVPGTGMVPDIVRIYHRFLRAERLSSEDRAWMEALVQNVGVRFRKLSLQSLAEFAAANGDPVESVVDYVQRAVEADLRDVTWMDRCPILSEARTTARWGALRARVDAKAALVRAAFAEG